MCENNQKNSVALHWKQDRILHLGTHIGANVGFHWHPQCMAVRACAAVQPCKEQQTWGTQS